MDNMLWCVMAVNPSDNNRETVWEVFHDGYKAEALCKEMNEFTKNHDSKEWFYCSGEEAGDTPGSYTKEQIRLAMWRVRDDLEDTPVIHTNTVFLSLAKRLGIEGY